MIKKIDRMLNASDADIDGMLGTLVSAMRSLDRGMGGIANVVDQNQEDLNALVDNAKAISEEALGAIRDARGWLQEGGKIDLILSDVRAVTQDLPQQADSLVANLDNTVSHVDRLVGQAEQMLGETLGEAQRRQLRSTIANLETVSDRAVEVADDVAGLVTDVRGQVDPMVQRIRGAVDGVGEIVDSAGQIVAAIRRGEGTVGALLMDEQIYDDLKELIRDLKHNPWKFFWRE
jgi:phospholipid/cholesterol/gamma-HCH transport system substrate-binding protein